MIGSVIAGIGLALQVSGTLVISFDALGSQKETTDSITFLDHVVGLLKTRDEYVKQVDFQKEFDNSYRDSRNCETWIGSKTPRCRHRKSRSRR